MSEQRTSPHVPIYYLSGNHDIGYSAFHSVHPEVIDYHWLLLVTSICIFTFFSNLKWLFPLWKYCFHGWVACHRQLIILCLVRGFNSLTREFQPFSPSCWMEVLMRCICPKIIEGCPLSRLVVHLIVFTTGCSYVMYYLQFGASLGCSGHPLAAQGWAACQGGVWCYVWKYMPHHGSFHLWDAIPNLYVR